MDQQPGQVFTPNLQDDDQPVAVNQPMNDEIAQIDSAMSEQPVRPEPVTPVGAEPANDTQNDTSGAAEVATPVVSDQSVAVNTDLPPMAAPADVDVPAEDTAGVAPTDEPLLVWEAIEDATPWSTQWYIAVTAVAAVLGTAMVLVFGSWFSAAVIILAAIALVVAYSRRPHVQEYGIFSDGVQIEQQYYLFTQLRAFSTSSGQNQSLIELEPAKRFLPRLTLHLDPEITDRAVEILEQFLPHSQRQPDVIDRLSKRLRM